MVARYVAYRESAAAEWEPVGVEAEFRVRVGRAVVAGRVDRIERDRSGRLRIVDLKTGTSKPTKAELLELSRGWSGGEAYATFYLWKLLY